MFKQLLFFKVWLKIDNVLMLGYMLHIPSLTKLGFYLSFFGFLSFINSYLYKFILCHV